MRRAFLLLACALAAERARAAPPSWWLIETSDQSPYRLYVDIASVVREGSARRFIAKMVPNAPADPTQATDIASVLVRVKIDCRRNIIEVRSGRMLDQSGDVTS